MISLYVKFGKLRGIIDELVKGTPKTPKKIIIVVSNIVQIIWTAWRRMFSWTLNAGPSAALKLC